MHLFVIGVEEVVGEGISDEHHLYLEGYRFWLQAHCRYEPYLLSQFLYLDLFIPEGSLQSLPGQRLPQDGPGIGDQITAIGSMQSSTSYHVEIGHQSAELSPVLDPTYQVAVGRVGLQDDRCSFKTGVVNQDVNPVVVEGGPGSGQG